jgi:hypothetical protein
VFRVFASVTARQNTSLFARFSQNFGDKSDERRFARAADGDISDAYDRNAERKGFEERLFS